MNWLKTYHEDHKSVLLLLAKFEGNIMSLKAGQDTPNTYTEFTEFGDVIKNVIIPHFKNEETDIYKTISESGPAGKNFTDRMLNEHDALYELFDHYLAAVEAKDKDKLIEISERLEKILHHHILQEEDELPKIMVNK